MRYAHCLNPIRLMASLILAVGHLSTSRLVPQGIMELLLSGIASILFLLMSGFVVASTNGFWTRPWHSTASLRAGRLLFPNILAFSMLIPMIITGPDRLPIDQFILTLAIWSVGMQNLSDTLYWNGPSWTVAPLLIGGLTLPILRQLRARAWPLQAVLALLVTLLGSRFLIELVQPSPVGFLEAFPRHKAILPSLLVYFSGGVAAVLSFKLRASAITRWLATDTGLLLSLAIAFASLLTAQRLDGEAGIFFFAHGVFPVLGLFIVVSAYWNQGRLNTLCAHPWVTFGGEMSIYIWLFQYPIDWVLKVIGYRNGVSTDDMMNFPFVATSFVCTLAASAFCQRLANIIRARASSAPPTPGTPAPAAP